MEVGNSTWRVTCSSNAQCEQCQLMRHTFDTCTARTENAARKSDSADCSCFAEKVKRCRRTYALSAAGQHISLRECHRVVNNDCPYQVRAVQLIRNVVEEENKEGIKEESDKSGSKRLGTA